MLTVNRECRHCAVAVWQEGNNQRCKGETSGSPAAQLSFGQEVWPSPEFARIALLYDHSNCASVAISHRLFTRAYKQSVKAACQVSLQTKVCCPLAAILSCCCEATESCLTGQVDSSMGIEPSCQHFGWRRVSRKWHEYELCHVSWYRQFGMSGSRRASVIPWGSNENSPLRH